MHAQSSIRRESSTRVNWTLASRAAAERANELSDRKNPIVLDTLARICFLSGESKKAVEAPGKGTRYCCKSRRDRAQEGRLKKARLTRDQREIESMKERLNQYKNTLQSATNQRSNIWENGDALRKMARRIGKRDIGSGSGTGPILARWEIDAEAQAILILILEGLLDFGPPYAGGPYDDRPIPAPIVSRLPSAIPAGRRGGLVARFGAAIPVPARLRFD